MGNVNFFLCDLTFETRKQLVHNLGDEHSNRVRNSMERVYDPDEDDYILVPKTKPKA